jgi:hypothetical protein
VAGSESRNPEATPALRGYGCGDRLTGPVCCVAARSGTIRGTRAVPTATGTTQPTATTTLDFGWWCSHASVPAIPGGVTALPGRGETWRSLFLAVPGNHQAGRIATAPHLGARLLVRGNTHIHPVPFRSRVGTAHHNRRMMIARTVGIPSCPSSSP